MHFLFDENMPIRLAKGLEILDAENDYGKIPVNKFTDITEYYKKAGANDPDIVRLAKKNNAIIVSEDDDYKNITATCELVKKLRVGYVLFKLPKKVGRSYDDIVSAFVSAWPALKKEVSGKAPPYMYIIERSGKISLHEKFRR